LNEKDFQKNYPLLYAAQNNNTKIVKLIIDYANNHNIELNLNKKNDYGKYPLLYAIKNNNIEMVKVLIKYSN